jgi:methionyl-tRNA formyltransferase
MKIAFIGTVEFSKSALEKLIQLKADIVTVCTRTAAGNHSDYADLMPLCRQNNIECVQTENINSPEIKKLLQDKNIDYIFCLGWSQLLDKKLLSIPAKGTIGFHPALLPADRGRHPIIWALALGLEKTGSTFFFIDEGVDSGDILSQKEIEISYNDDARSLYNKITNTALEQIEEFLPQLEAGNFRIIKQNGQPSNTWRKRNKQDGQIDWRMSSLAIYNLARALTRPYVGAHFAYKDREIKVWKAKEHKAGSNNIEPGKITQILPDKTFIVKAGENSIHVLEYEPSNIVFEKGEYLQ